MASTCLPDIPIEIFGQIISFVPHKGLKCVRQVSRAFDDFAKRELFRTVHLKVNLDSFRRLKQISLHANLALHVQKISYDGSLLPWDYVDFDEYRFAGIGRGFNFIRVDPQGQPILSSSDSLEAFRSYFTEEDLDEHHQQYCEYLEGQKALHRGSNEVDLLAQAFARLPRLTSLEFRSGTTEFDGHIELYDTTRDSLAAALSSSYVGQRTLIKPHITRGVGNDLFGVKRVVALIEAAVSANNKVTKLSASVMDLVRMNDKVETLTTPRVRNFLGRLASLVMAVSDDGPPEACSKVLEMASSVESLDLSSGSFLNRAGRASDMELCRVTPTGSHWPHLRHLTLDMFKIQQAWFTEFLHAHVSTLMTVALRNMHVSEGSLVEILIFLAESMGLKEFKLEGHMMSTVDGEWDINPSAQKYNGCGMHLHYSSTYCLLHRVERYVLRKGSCPFTREEDATDGAAEQTVRMRWVADFDETFHRT